MNSAVQYITGESLPGLYQAADAASLAAQRRHFWALKIYLVLLMVAAAVPYLWPSVSAASIASAVLFMTTLCILIYSRVKKPDDEWYNGRAVAESVKTRAWRWCMRADPYGDGDDSENVETKFSSDLRLILSQNQNLASILSNDSVDLHPITKEMKEVRAMTVGDRLAVYRRERIDDQAKFYSLKSLYNGRQARNWFVLSVVLHAVAIVLLLVKIREPLADFPIELVATAASAALTWLQAKKHSELNSSYSLAAHEITFIANEADSVVTEGQLSIFVINSEPAFSREHTQWVARKRD